MTNNCVFTTRIYNVYTTLQMITVSTHFVEKVLLQIIQKYKLLKKLFKLKFEEKTLSFLPPSLLLSFTHTATERKTDLVLLNRRDED